MVRRVLLLAILVATPVAEVRAEFLFADPQAATAEESTAGAGVPSDERPVPPTDSSEIDEFRPKSAGLESAGSSPTTGFTGALPAPATQLAEGGLLSFLLGEASRRYQPPSHAGPLRPPRGAC